MNKIHILRGILIGFLVFQFFSCDNEPLEGDFPPRNEESIDSIEMKFEALIDGDKFVATTIEALISEESELYLSGENSAGQKIILKVAEVSIDTFHLRGSEGEFNSGTYYKKSKDHPYTTFRDFGGGGSLTMDSLNTNKRVFSGTFRMDGVRPKLDKHGEPVVDENGDPVMQEMAVREGVFTNIQYEIGEDPGEGTFNERENDFYARVDGTDFNGKYIQVRDTTIAGTNILQIQAKNAHYDMIRIDVPKHLQVGNHSMKAMSNGSELTGVYKAIDGEVLTSDPGTLTITELDLEAGILQAEFEFEARDPLGGEPEVVNIKRGKMKVFFDGIVGANNSFLAKVNGQYYMPDRVLVETDTVNQFNRYVINTELQDRNREMSLSFPQNLQEGNTYTISDEVRNGNEIVAVYIPNGEISFTSQTGEFTIVLYDEEEGIIEGVFEFSALDPTGNDPSNFNVTEGEFRIYIP